MKKIFGILLGLGLLCSSVVANEKESKKPSFGWFAGVGMGMMAYDLSVPNFALNVNGGVMFPQTERLRHLIFADLGYASLDSFRERVEEAQTGLRPQNLESNGYGIDFTLNYNLSYDVFQSDHYAFAIFGGAGVGISYGEIKDRQIEPTAIQTSFVNSQSFIANLNFGLRNIIFKNHAIDLSFKTRMADIQIAGGDPTFKAPNQNFAFLISYTFLNF